MNIGQSIREIRKEKGVQQRELADKVGISYNALSQIETGRTYPQQATLTKISVVLEVPISYILFNSVEVSEVEESKRPVLTALKDAIYKLLFNKQ